MPRLRRNRRTIRRVGDPERFSDTMTKGGRVRIAFRGRHVVTVAGRRAERLGAELAGANDERAQLLLATAPGNFKRGNERRAD